MDVLANVTSSHFPPNYCRKEVHLEKDDPRFKLGHNIQNRVEAPLPEIPGDIFDRQRVIYEFNQSVVENQVCLVLGVGGIGQNVALTLARLGVRKLIYLDNDTYDASNLTRQLLGQMSDVGSRKVDVVTRNLCFHKLRSEFEGHDVDAVNDWSTVVTLARQCDVIFNCIDVGTVFDHAVNSLSKALGIPLVQGQSSGWAANAEFFSGLPGELCASCQSSTVSSFAVEGRYLQVLWGRLQEWLSTQPDVDPQALTTTNIFSFLASDPQYKIEGETASSLIEKSISMVSNGVAIAVAEFDKFIGHYYSCASTLLLPAQITTLKDVGFIPKPAHIPTRYVGSFVCPCLLASVLMVSSYANFLTGPTDRNPPQCIQFSLASGQTDMAEQALEMGFVADAPPRARDSSSPTCAVCAQAIAQAQAKALQEQSNALEVARGRKSEPQDALSDAVRDGDHEEGEEEEQEQEEGVFFSLFPVHLRRTEGLVLPFTIAPPASPCNADIVTGSAAGGRGDDDPPLAKYPRSSGDSGGGGGGGGGGVEYLELRAGTLWRSVDHLGPEYANLVVDAVPCKEPASLQHSPSLSSGSALLPPLLQRPWVKTSAQRGDPAIEAYGSGVRSALVRDTTTATWYRLKGCGMPNVEFTVVDVRDDQDEVVLGANGSPLRKIRGSSYQHTSEIELGMSGAVDRALRPLGLRCANRPLGRWDYALPPEGTEFPAVTRSCTLFETDGDRRLGDHLLRGVELLLSLLVGDKGDQATASAIEALHGTGLVDMDMGRHRDHLPGVDIEDWDEYDGRLPRAILLYSGGSGCPSNVFADLARGGKALRGLGVPCEGDFPVGAPPSLRPVWVSCCRRLRRWLETLPCSSPQSGAPAPLYREEALGRLVARLYLRCGAECGLVSGAFSNEGVVWGSYRDSTGFHMNAHANNFIVVREGRGEYSRAGAGAGSQIDNPNSESDGTCGQGGDVLVGNGREGTDLVRPSPARSLLAPLDFDMAYTRDTCCFANGPEADRVQFEEMAERELSELGFNIAMCQSGRESSSTGTRPPAALPAHLGLVRLALRDTLVRGWLEAVQAITSHGRSDGAVGASGGTSGGVGGEVGDERDGVDASRHDPSSLLADILDTMQQDRELMYCLVKLALIMTWDVVA